MTDTTDPAVQCLLAFLEEEGDAVGFEPRAARRWLSDSLLLAGHAANAPSDTLAEAPLLAAVYRDLEAIERSTRAELLRGLARVLCRRIPCSLGSAALDLIAPLSRGAADALRGGFLREAGRRVSARLFARPCVVTGSPSILGAGADAGADVGSAALVVRAFAGLACELQQGLEERLAVTEVRLALDGGSAIALELDAHASTIDDLEGAPAAREFVARDHLARLRAAAAFVARDDADVLEILLDGPLALDRSASAGALWAASAHRQRRDGPCGVELPAPRRGGFADPVDAHERKRIACFLAAASKASPQTEVEST